MTKKYRLTLEFEAIINEKVEGIGDTRVISYVQEFLDEIKKDPDALYDYMHFMVFSFHFHNDSQKIMEINNVKDEAEILNPVIQRLSPQASDYLTRLFSDPEKTLTLEENDMHSDLFRGQVDIIEIPKVSMEEVKEEK